MEIDPQGVPRWGGAFKDSIFVPARGLDGALIPEHHRSSPLLTREKDSLEPDVSGA